MDYSQIILTVNFSSIVILVLLAAVLLAATRFYGENGYAAAIIVLPNLPVYLYNMSRMLGWHDLTLFMFPIGFSVNTMLMPLLWLFTEKNFDPGFRFRPRLLLHFLPAIVCLGIALMIPPQERLDIIKYEMTGDDTWLGDVNAAILIIQLIVYFTAIFRFLYRKKRAICDNTSEAEWLQKEWIPQLMILFAVLFVIVMSCYVLWPRTDAWLIQILNIVAIVFLVYNSVAHPMIPVHPQPASGDSAPVSTLSREQMQEICGQTSEYLTSTKAYLRPDLSLAMLARETNIPGRNLSRSINTYLQRNFFEYINQMRVEEAKRLLLNMDASGYTVDSIYSECGFRSRSTFFLAFKKVEGKTPGAWLKEYNKKP